MDSTLSPDNMPLVRASPLTELYECFQENAGHWFLSNRETSKIGHQVLENCRAVNGHVFADCIYLFAGKVYPDIETMPVIFVYGAAVEENHSGSVSPFDTGGLWTGKIHPYYDKPRACQLIANTAETLPTWRAAFTTFLTDFFEGKTQRYLARTPPAPATPLQGSWRTDLPVHHKDNWNSTVGKSHLKESRAWTWEIRLHQAIPILNTHLIFAAANPGTIDALENWVEKQKQLLKNNTFPDPEKQRAIASAQDLLRRLPQSQLGSRQSQSSFSDRYERIVDTERRIAKL